MWMDPIPHPENAPTASMKLLAFSGFFMHFVQMGSKRLPADLRQDSGYPTGGSRVHSQGFQVADPCARLAVGARFDIHMDSCIAQLRDSALLRDQVMSRSSFLVGCNLCPMGSRSGISARAAEIVKKSEGSLALITHRNRHRGQLAAAPLPHHPACGSAPGDSRS